MPYVGIMGGTFDPIHFGHLAAAEGARQQLGLDRVLFMPNRQPPHKVGQRVSATEHRAAMVKLAIAGNPDFAYTDLELHRAGPSYTIDTIRVFHELHPDWRSAFVVGMDSLLEIQTWQDYPTLLTLTDLVVVSRPGYPAKRRDAVLAALGPALTARIRLLETPGVAVSATELRRLSAEGKSLRYLVPDAVAEYVREHQLYE
jgi:nicotinate-nucleotide adenylyltransferase